MRYIDIHLTDGRTLQLPCLCFTHQIGGVAFEFALHALPGHAGKVLTFVATGRKVCDVPAGLAHPRYEMARARGALNRLIRKLGAARMRAVLTAGRHEANRRSA
jgi:hypothetical protein